MSGFVWCASAVVVLSIFSTGAAAEPPQASVQQPAAKSGDAALETVIVEAQRQRELLERQLSTFVSAITMPSRTESLARWERPLCPWVAGLPLDQGQFVFERISQVASEAGIPLDSRDCTPNLLVVMTREPEGLLQDWWRKNSRLFNQDRGVGEIKDTIRAAAPVRVFYNACSAAPPERSFALRVTLDCDSRVVLTGSRLTWSAVRAIYSVIVVVDLRQVEGLKIASLADYIAMVALAQIRRDPELGAAPTILGLFNETDRARPQGLSRWDQEFLKSLYGTDSSIVMQVSTIKDRMKRNIAR